MRKNINYFKTYEIEDFKDMLNKTVERNSKEVAFRLKDSDGKIYNKTYMEFKEDVEQLGTKLIDMGLKNRRIAIMGKNSYFWAISYLAVTIVGIAVPIDKESSMENVKEFLKVSDADAIIADSKYLDEIFKIGIDKNIVLIDMQNTSKYNNIEDIIGKRKRTNNKWK